RPQIVRGVVQTWGVAIAQAAVHLDPRPKALRAECASFGAGSHFQRTAGADSITEFPGTIGEVLLKDQVLAEVPSFIVAAQDQLELKLSLALLAGNGIYFDEVADTIVAHDFQQAFVGAVDVFELDVQHRIDPVLASQRAETVFPAESGEDGTVLRGAHAIQIELGSPPGFGAILELHRRS